MPTEYGDFKAIGYESIIDGQCHMALVAGDPTSPDALVRVHSECLTGDVFSSKTMRLWRAAPPGPAAHKRERQWSAALYAPGGEGHWPCQ